MPHKHKIIVYILDFTSHPLILGTGYFINHGIVLDFNKFSVNCCKQSAKLRLHHIATIPPKTEMMLYAKVPKSVSIGQRGICDAHPHVLHKGLFVSKAVVLVSTDKIIPIKVLNPGDESVFLSTNTVVANFTPFDNFSC